MEIPKKILEDFEKYCRDKGIDGKRKDDLRDKLKAVLENSKYEPGEAIGIIAAQSISEPATQMSLDAEEKVIVKHKGRIRIVKIGEFVDRIMERNGYEKIGDSEVAALSEGAQFYVPSLDHDEKVQWKPIVEVSRHNAPEKLLKITTASGRTIVATDSHSFVIRKNNSIIPMKGSQLEKGSRIPSIKYIPENCAQYLELSELKIGNDKTCFRKKLPDRLELTNLLGWFFGIYLSEGNCTKNYVSISNTNEAILAKARMFAENFDLTYNEYDNFRGFARGHDIRINSTLLSRLMETCCGTGASSKKVPEFAYSAKEEFVAGLLRGYFDGDGSVSATRKMIRAHSNSQELIDGIKLLLTRFGIFAHKKRDGKQFYLLIPYKYAPIFKEKIGSDIEEKAERLSLLSKMAEKFINERSHDFTEMVSGFDDVLAEAARKLGYPTRFVNNFTRRQKIGITTLRHYIELFTRLSQERGKDISKELEVMRRMADSDVVWDEITALEYVKPTSEKVYDFSVDGMETFTTFDGIITHNTMRSYTLATMVGGLTKIVQGLPRMIEIFDLRKTFDKSMTIYLKEKYNTKQQAEKIAEEIREKKIKDVIKSHSIDLLNMQLELEFEREGDASSLKEILGKFGEVSKREKKLIIKPEKTDLKGLRKLKDKILYIRVGGVDGIDDIVVVKSNENWVLRTTGSNLKAVLEDERIDDVRTTTDDIEQVYDVLGIEAARNCILREAKQTLSEQGLDVDMRHLMLVADVMCADGSPEPIGRYGVAGSKPSVLAKANFEETKKHLSSAAYSGKTDRLVGVVENVMIGQLIPVGTGCVDLFVDIEKMRGRKEKKE